MANIDMQEERYWSRFAHDFKSFTLRGSHEDFIFGVIKLLR